jgi:hypothetical protein
MYTRSLEVIFVQSLDPSEELRALFELSPQRIGRVEVWRMEDVDDVEIGIERRIHIGRFSTNWRG